MTAGGLLAAAAKGLFPPALSELILDAADKDVSGGDGPEFTSGADAAAVIHAAVGLRSVSFGLQLAALSKRDIEALAAALPPGCTARVCLSVDAEEDADEEEGNEAEAESESESDDDDDDDDEVMSEEAEAQEYDRQMAATATAFGAAVAAAGPALALTSVFLSGAMLFDESTAALITSLGHGAALRHLRSFSVFCEDGLRDASFAALGRAIAAGACLALTVVTMKVSAVGARAFAAALLSSGGAAAAAAAQQGGAPLPVVALRDLFLDRSPLRPEGLLCLAAALPSLPALRLLSLADTDGWTRVSGWERRGGGAAAQQERDRLLRDPAFASALKALLSAPCPSLESLFLENNPLLLNAAGCADTLCRSLGSGPGSGSITSSSSGAPRLKNLCLSFCRLGNATAAALGAALANNSSLTSLSLRASCISATGAKARGGAREKHNAREPGPVVRRGPSCSSLL